MTRATAVIVVFHRPASLARLLTDLRHPDLQIVVVNIENDGAVHDLAAGAGVEHVGMVDNVGYGAGVNAGLSRAHAPVTVFMNDDLVADAATVLGLAEVVSRGEADVAVPLVRTAAGEVERTVTALPGPGALALEWLLLPDAPVSGLRRVARVQKWRLPTVPEPVDAAAAVMVAVRTDLLRDTPMPEDYFLYWEESDWFAQLRAASARVVYRPELSVLHRGGRGDIRPDKAQLLARNAVRAVRRTRGRGAAMWAWPIVVLWQLRLLIVAVLRRRFVRARWAGLKAAGAAWRELL